MLNLSAKCLLVLTSLSPVLGAVAINQFAYDKLWTSWGEWFVGALLLVILCWTLLRYAQKNAQKHLFYTVAAVKDVITGHPEWEAKLGAAFSDANIAAAIKQSDALLGAEIAGGSHA